MDSRKPKAPPESLEEDLEAFLDENEKDQREKNPPDEFFEDIP